MKILERQWGAVTHGNTSKDRNGILSRGEGSFSGSIYLKRNLPAVAVREVDVSVHIIVHSIEPCPVRDVRPPTTIDATNMGDTRITSLLDHAGENAVCTPSISTTNKAAHGSRALWELPTPGFCQPREYVDYIRPAASARVCARG